MDWLALGLGALGLFTSGFVFFVVVRRGDSEREALDAFLEKAELSLSDTVRKRLTNTSDEVRDLKSEFVGLQTEWLNYKQNLNKIAGRITRERQVADGTHKGGPNSRGVLAQIDENTTPAERARLERWALGSS